MRNWPDSLPHSTEIEHRLTTIEVVQQQSATTNEARWQFNDTRHAASEARLSFLERAIQVIIYALAALATSKSGDWVGKLLEILKARP